MQNDVTLRVASPKSFREIYFWNYKLDFDKHQISFRVTNWKLKSKKFHFKLTKTFQFELRTRS